MQDGPDDLRLGGQRPGLARHDDSTKRSGAPHLRGPEFDDGGHHLPPRVLTQETIHPLCDRLTHLRGGERPAEVGGGYSVL